MHGVHDRRSLLEQLAPVDLNLMVAFEALASERHVTRAAERVGLTQSAMSHALRRLRELLSDPLLVRGTNGMVLTPRAESLLVPIRSALQTLGRALCEPAEFSPRTSSRAFRLGTLDLFDVVVIPALLARLRSDAPQVDLAVLPASGSRLFERLETGELDVAVMVQPSETRALEAPRGIVRRKLFSDGWSCFLRRQHPRLTGPRPTLSLATYAGLGHVMVSPTGQGPGLVDEVLARHGLTRRVALSIPHFSSALAIVEHSDLVLTAPTTLARLAARARIRTLTPPVPLGRHGVHLVWHERYTKDAGHAWLRALLIELAKAAPHTRDARVRGA